MGPQRKTWFRRAVAEEMGGSQINVGVLRTGVGEGERKRPWEAVESRSFGHQSAVLSVCSSLRQEERDRSASATEVKPFDS